MTTPATASCQTIMNSISESYTEEAWSLISIESVAMTASATNLLLECLAKSDKIATEGYKSITFMRWTSLDGLLDSDVLTMLADASKNAESFTFDQQSSLGFTSSLTSDQQFQLADFSTTMLNTSSMLQEVEVLDLSMEITAEQTTTILTNWSQSTNIAATTLTTLALEYANFSTVAASQALASLVNVAPQATLFNIEEQNVDRPVRIVVTPASTDSDGSITINNLITNELVYTMITTRSMIPSVWYGDVIALSLFSLDALVKLNFNQYDVPYP